MSSRVLTPPERLTLPPNRETPPSDSKILNPPEFRHLKLRELLPQSSSQ